MLEGIKTAGFCDTILDVEKRMVYGKYIGISGFSLVVEYCDDKNMLVLLFYHKKVIYERREVTNGKLTLYENEVGDGFKYEYDSFGNKLWEIPIKEWKRIINREKVLNKLINE
jgi:hypothetical protein